MKRIATAVVLIPVVVWLVLYGPQWALLAALAVVGLLALHEFDSIAAAQGIPKAGWPGMLAGVVLLLAPEPLLPVMGMIAVALMMLALRAKDLAQALPGAAVSVLGVIYIFGAWRCAVALRTIHPHWMMIALLVCWAGDTAAMYVGKAFGRHKLAPRVSPAKTWEGAWASVAGGMLAAFVYAHYLLPDASLPLVLLAGGLGNVAGQFGDLCESAFKRGAGVKDSGTTLPGHGGWLDRIDASLFSVPVIYGLLVAWRSAI